MISLKQRDPEHGAVFTGRIARAIPGAPGGLQLLEVFSWVGKTGVCSKGGPYKMTPCKCSAIFFFNTNQLQCLPCFCVGLRQFEPLTAAGPLSTFPPCPLAGSPGPITTALRWKPLCPSRVSRGRPTASTREQYRAISTPCAPSLSCIRRKASHTHER